MKVLILLIFAQFSLVGVDAAVNRYHFLPQPHLRTPRGIASKTLRWGKQFSLVNSRGLKTFSESGDIWMCVQRRVSLPGRVKPTTSGAS